MLEWEKRQELPNNLEAEQAVLGSVLANNEVLFDLTPILTKEDFYEPWHGNLFGYMRDQIEAARQISVSTAVYDFAQDKEIAKGLKVSDYLRILADSAVPSATAPDIARIVRDLSIKRRIIDVADRVQASIRSSNASLSADAIRMQLDAEIQSLFGGVEEMGIRHVGDIGKAVIARINSAYMAERVIGLPVGLKGVQDLIGPLMPGRLYLLCGPPGSGKSALASQMAEFIAGNAGPAGEAQPVLFDEIEMPGEEMAERILASRADVEAERIERAALDESEMNRLVAAQEKAAKLHLWIDSGSNPTVAMIRARALRMKRLRGLAALFIDHLLYIAPPDTRAKEHEAVRANLQGLKRLAKDLSIPVVCLTQPTKEYTSGAVRRPKVADMYGGAANEQEADVILLLWREEYMLRRAEPLETDKGWAEWKARLDQVEGKAEAILGKRRGAKGFGLRTLYFDAPRMRFFDNIPRRFIEDRQGSLISGE